MYLRSKSRGEQVLHRADLAAERQAARKVAAEEREKREAEKRAQRAAGEGEEGEHGEAGDERERREHTGHEHDGSGR